MLGKFQTPRKILTILRSSKTDRLSGYLSGHSSANSRCPGVFKGYEDFENSSGDSGNEVLTAAKMDLKRTSEGGQSNLMRRVSV